MNRRAFMALLGAGAVGAGVDIAHIDVDRLLWTPGAKTYFLPPAPVDGLTDLNECALAVFRELHKELVRLGAKPMELVTAEKGFRVGEPGRVLQANLPGGYGAKWKPEFTKQIFTHQSSVMMEVPQENKRFAQVYDVTRDAMVPSMVGTPAAVRRRELLAVAHQLAQRVMQAQRPPTMCGSMYLPSGCDAVSLTDPKRGLALRAVRAFEVESQTLMQRFDVITG